jgi:hypothetical protein
VTIADILQGIEQSALANAVGGNLEGTEFFFPVIETLHVIAVAVVFGSIFMVDLRLLGRVERNQSAVLFIRELLPWTWTAFAGAVITGSLMFIAHATAYWDNTQFRFKFLALALAGCNMLIFHAGVYRRIEDWNFQLPAPTAARAAGLLSIVLWLAVIFLGRWVGFTT